ncbi:hypothetical protein [Flavobacterium sp. 102]|uniref:hypothetical protein n=1 Tax=Flavobacterium sp. 102 TaxID=2135623 RepID=UPI000EB53E9F|nr:hypothetical protein [Flavobacterium sp. 102]RKS03061.1 hypothetical protein C8C84_2802 [Flavobacterium sp. 102]
MDAFEQIIGQLLEEDGFWVRYSVKINLTKQEKVEIGKATTPRPEIDIVAYKPTEKTLYLIEAKSFLDSAGVVFEHAIAEQDIQHGRYKLLTSLKYRNVLKNRLKIDWVNQKIIADDTIINFGLIAGKVHKNREAELEENFNAKGWLFWGPTKIKSRLTMLSAKAYENNAVTIAAKLLTR